MISLQFTNISYINLSGILLLIIPLTLLQFGLMIAAIISIVNKDERELRWNNKIIWILIVVLVNIIGPILYFIIGTDDKNNGSNTGGYNNDGYYYK